MADITLTNRHDAEFYKALPTPNTIDLCENNSHVDAVQVCRTCVNSKNRTWNTPAVEEMVYVRSGGKREDLFCQPDKPWGTFKVLNQIDWRDRIVPLNRESAVPTRAVVETCGQQVLPDCAKCDRFNATVVRVAYSSSPTGKLAFKTVEREGGKRETVPYVTDDTPVRYWNVTIGGSCGIGKNGVVVEGVTKFCDWQPRKKRVESPSCANCYYLDNKGESWQFHHLEVNENARLTPYEREQIPADEYALELWRKQTSPIGRRYWFAGEILKTGERNGQTIFKIRFKKSNRVGIIAADDDRMTVHCLGDNVAAVDILYPYNLQFNLTMPMHKQNRIWPKLPTHVRLANDQPDLVRDWCEECRLTKACYYHAKNPVTSALGNIEFDNPKGRSVEWIYPPHGLLHVEERQGKVVAVDGNGDVPTAYSDTVANAAVFRMWLATLMEQAGYKYGPQGQHELYQQYLSVHGMLALVTKLMPYRPNWIRNTSMEPGKSYCSHPEGPDLRKVFQDSFGSERVDWEFDHGSMTHDQVEEEIRVGYRQHTQTPQRLQEEILSTDASHPAYDPSSGAIQSSPISFIGPPVVLKIEAIGDMYHDDGTPVTDVDEFMDALLEEVVIGEAGMVERKISKRQQLFGYDMTRGYYGKRRGFEKTAMPAADPTFVVFPVEDMDPEQIDIDDAWVCVECNRHYDQSEVDFFTPTCEDCNVDLYKNHNTRTTHNPRAGGGVGNAFVMDNARMQERTRLYSTLCPKWRLNAGTIITLDDIHGPSSVVPAGATPMGNDEKQTVLKVGGYLSTEQRQANDEYNALMDAVVRKRSEHMDKYPETTAEELHELYPTPHGTIYQRKAETSLSKMGSV